MILTEKKMQNSFEVLKNLHFLSLDGQIYVYKLYRI